ncbi:MAG TPA: excinuclease ABC subunit UvrC, partial [Candidatus Acidoferrales bacterium]|nr:excinuclease ABC subunit UvrC [Candidatus Acidoferrales bacterium]
QPGKEAAARGGLQLSASGGLVCYHERRLRILEHSIVALPMELSEQVANLPLQPGVYLFHDAAGKILYVGKASSLRQRVRSYFLESSQADAKTGSLVREIAEIETIVLDNEKEALALENNLIKRHQPKFNVLLRDDKTYPYIRYTAFEKYPRVYVTRRLTKDGSVYFGPYFPARLAYRMVHLIHKHFLVPSCSVDLTRHHPRPCLQYYIHRCLGPCVAGLTTDERYAEAARDVRLFLEGRRHDLVRSLEERMMNASDEERYEEAAGYRDLLRTLTEMEERQKMAAAAGDDTDVLAWYAEPPQVAANLFHLRGGRVVDRRDFYWEDLAEFDAAEFLPSLLKQVYLEAAYLPRFIHVPQEFEERALLEEVLSEASGHAVEILTPQRGPKRALLDLVEKNARHSFMQRFRVLRPSSKAIIEALENALGLPEPPRRIESFDISHIQGTDTVASLVVWEEGRMKKSAYRKFIIRGRESGSDGERMRDDFASMREVVARRYARLQAEKKPLPSLILIDGGIGQLHAASAALDELAIINQPMASIAKEEEILYVLGRESEPIRLERHSPILHLIQQIRDETHRFAVTFHRQRRGKRQVSSELLQIPGVGPRTAQKLLRRFGSVARLRALTVEDLAAVVTRPQAQRVFAHLHESSAAKLQNSSA